MYYTKRILATVGLVISSAYVFGQINIGTAADFILFTSVGAITNTGPSHFVGDIGSQEGAITGFPPGTLTGQIHNVDPTTLQAAADVESAYSDLSATPCGITIGGGLGVGQILTPNVYCITTAATLSGELFFDGEGNPNAVFIVKVTGLIDVMGLSTVTLINSAQINNIFWQIDGAVNIGAAADFKGVILANGALSLATGAVLTGNGLCRQGAINTDNVNASLSIDSGLPIELISFDGEKQHKYNYLRWSTASEANNNYFTLERTSDGQNYIEVIRLNGAGSSTTVSNYSYSDFDFENELNYYRLCQTDFDGNAEILGLISIDNMHSNQDVVKVFNSMGQKVNSDYIGLRFIYFSTGEIVKTVGTYLY
jgi:hypothetical protein